MWKRYFLLSAHMIPSIISIYYLAIDQTTKLYSILWKCGSISLLEFNCKRCLYGIFCSISCSKRVTHLLHQHSECRQNNARPETKLKLFSILEFARFECISIELKCIVSCACTKWKWAKWYDLLLLLYSKCKPSYATHTRRQRKEGSKWKMVDGVCDHISWKKSKFIQSAENNDETKQKKSIWTLRFSNAKFTKYRTAENMRPS